MHTFISSYFIIFHVFYILREDEKNMKRKNILKEAGVLLIVSLMVLSIIAVTGAVNKEYKEKGERNE